MDQLQIVTGEESALAVEDEIVQVPAAEVEQPLEVETEQTPAAEVEQVPEVEVEQPPDAEIEEPPEAEVEQAPAAEIEQPPEAEVEEPPEAEIEQVPDAEVKEPLDVDAPKGDSGEMGELDVDAWDYKRPKRGQVRTGIILEIRDQEIIVDVGDKRDGIVPYTDIQRLSPEELDELSPGDEVLVFIMRPEDQDGNLLVSLHLAKQEKAWHRAKEMFENGTSWEGEVIGYNKGGLVVPVEDIRGFVPASQVPGFPSGLGQEERLEQLASMVGETLRVKVIEINRRKRRLILSATRAQREWRKTQRQRLLEDLREGEVRSGRVTSLCSFGAFVDLGGADGLVHLSELSWRRIRHPREVVNVGDRIEVYVLRLDVKKKRIGLSLKRLQPEPWSLIEDKYELGQLVEGVVTNVVDFGAFAEIEDGVEGLIHVSELANASVSHPRDVVKKGDLLLLRIIRVDTRRKRLGLSLKRVLESEWAEWAARLAVAEAEKEAAAREAEPPTVAEVKEALEETVAEEVAEAEVVLEVAAAIEVAEIEEALEEVVAEEVAEAEIALEVAAAVEVAEIEEALEEAVAEEVAETEAVLEMAAAIEVAAIEGALEEAAAEEVAEAEVALELQAAAEVAEIEAALEEAAVDGIEEIEEALEEAVAEEVAETEAALELEAATEVAEIEEALEEAVAEEVAEAEIALELEAVIEVAEIEEVLEEAVAEEVAEAEISLELEAAIEVAEIEEALEEAVAEEVDEAEEALEMAAAIETAEIEEALELAVEKDVEEEPEVEVVEKEKLVEVDEPADSQPSASEA